MSGPPPLAFVLGTGRCGSTVVHEALARHRDVGFLSNIEDRLPGAAVLAPWTNTVHRHLPPGATTKGRLRFAPSEGYRAIARDVSPVLVDPSRDLTDADLTPWLDRRLRAFFSTRAARTGGALFVHKFTGWPRARLLARAFPDARFVEVVRDGRAVANSLLQVPWWRGHAGPSAMPYGPLPEPHASTWAQTSGSLVALAGLQWFALMDAFEVARSEVGAARWLVVRYEDCVADPVSVLDEVRSFLALAPSESWRREVRAQGWSTGRLEAFRRDLSGEQVDLLEQLLAEPLDRYGYRHGCGDRLGGVRPQASATAAGSVTITSPGS